MIYKVSFLFLYAKRNRSFLVEIVLEALEDGVLRLLVALEVVAVLKVLDGFLLLAAQGLRHIHADVDHQVATSITVTLYGGQSLAAQAEGLAGLCAAVNLYAPSMVGISISPPSAAVGKSSNRL